MTTTKICHVCLGLGGLHDLSHHVTPRGSWQHQQPLSVDLRPWLTVPETEEVSVNHAAHCNDHNNNAREGFCELLLEAGGPLTPIATTHVRQQQQHHCEQEEASPLPSGTSG